ncbi:MAG: ATP-dependent DNA helicase RecG [Eubacteriales bacterium]
MDAQSSIRALPGIGEKIEKRLNKLGIATLSDLLLFMPRRYREIGAPRKIAELKIDESALMSLTVLSEPKTSYIKRAFSRTTFEAGDGTGIVTIVLFNQQFTVQKIKKGLQITVYGRLEVKFRTMQITSPEIYFEEPGAILPVYPLTQGISQAYLRKTIAAAMKNAALLDFYPPAFLQKFGVLPIGEAVCALHNPPDLETAARARDRLVFDELLVFSRTLELLEEDARQPSKIAIKTNERANQFLRLLPFEPTRAQTKVMGEIARDLSGQHIMNRLVQGDVGSGKTILAFFAMYCAQQSGYQSMLMAPTEILATQHFASAKKMFGDESVALVLGSQKAAQRRENMGRIQSGQSTIILGTHALLHRKTEFKNIGLIITDEQHRFGVKQRAALAGGRDVHMLTMSATPIPRSLALVLYGKTDISVVDELPPGRQPVSTYVVEQPKYDEMLKFIKNELDTGRQGYIVCPLIDEDENGDLKSANETFAQLKSVFGDQLALMHGRLKSEEKQSVMEAFAAGELKIIVSTTVIEVGVNVPNATVMCVMNAERFGLAQLHQLRGRVGRGAHKSYCFLVSDFKGAFERLQFLCKTQDGFAIAKKDMELRGGGDVFGTRQHGETRFAVANLLFDANMLTRAKEVLNEIKNDPAFFEIYNSVCIRAEESAKNTVVEIALN